MRSVIECRVLGPPEVRVDGAAAPPELLWRKNLALLVYLARSPRRTRTRDHLVGLLWGERPEAAARHSLNESLRVLRRHLGEGALASDGSGVRFTADAVRLDADRFETLAAAGRWAEAAALVGGTFMEGFGVPEARGVEDWLAAERMTCTRRGVECLERRAAELTMAGDPESALTHAERALALDPLSGVAVRALMRGRALGGDRSGALRAFEEFAARLETALRTEPDPETRLLADRVRRERGRRAPASSGGEGAGRSLRRTPLVGRERELSATLAAFSECRAAGRAGAAFIGGAAGAGKTRLGEEVAARCRLDGATVAAIRAVPADAADPWSGALGLARGGLLEAPGIVMAPPGALAWFAARLPEWRERFAREIGEAAPLPPGRALAELLRPAGEEGPVLLLVDDAQWLDAESLAALRGALRELGARPLFLLLVAAPTPAREEIEELRSRIGRDVPGVALHLARLGTNDLRELARWAMPAYAAPDLDRLTRRLEADSAGLPLLAVELLHAVELGLELEETPAPWPEASRTLDQTLPGELPDAVVAAIRIGFRRLGEEARHILVAAAVLADRVSPADVRRATGLEAAGLEAGLDELEWGRWLVAEPRGYAFVARLVREVIARDMVTPGQAERIRRRAAGG